MNEMASLDNPKVSKLVVRFLGFKPCLCFISLYPMDWLVFVALLSSLISNADFLALFRIHNDLAFALQAKKDEA